jgi:hypothetical protein
MAQIFTSNQVNHVLVATALKTSNGKVVKSDAVGTISVQKDAEGNMYFMHRGKGGLTRSDLLTNIMDVRYTPAPKMSRVQNAALITLNADADDASNNAIAGQDYLLRLEFQNPVGTSPDHKYWKYGVVHATTSMSKSSFYAKMAKSLAINMSREAVKLVNIYLFTSSTASNINDSTYLTEVDADPSQTLNDTYYGIKIVEAEQEWQLGIKQEKPIIFRINESSITDANKNEVYWADVLYTNGTKVTGGLEVAETVESSNLPKGNTLVNSKLAAELEYFAMGERADLYRGMGWPDYRPTEYIVDPTNAYGYDMINIHYAYVGSNHAVQMSEKDLTILVPRVSTDNDSTDELNAIGALAESIKGYMEAILKPVDTRYARISGDLTDGNVPEFDGTTGVIKDSGKASSAI